jgi:hypothetical protein
MIQITYNNSTIKSVGRTSDLETTPDDRQTLVKTVTSAGAGSVVVEDYGVVANGEVVALNANWSAADYATLKGYWSNRTKVNITLDDGTTISNARIVIKGVSYADDVLNSYKKVNFEIWRV